MKEIKKREKQALLQIPISAQSNTRVPGKCDVLRCGTTLQGFSSNEGEEIPLVLATTEQWPLLQNHTAVF